MRSFSAWIASAKNAAVKVPKSVTVSDRDQRCRRWFLVGSSVLFFHFISLFVRFDAALAHWSLQGSIDLLNNFHSHTGRESRYSNEKEIFHQTPSTSPMWAVVVLALVVEVARAPSAAQRGGGVRRYAGAGLVQCIQPVAHFPRA